MAAGTGRHHPTTDAFYLSTFLTNEEGDELVKENPAYDELALFRLVEDGVGRYFDRIEGTLIVDEHGANRWAPNASNESYLVIRDGMETELAALLTDRIIGND